MHFLLKLRINIFTVMLRIVNLVLNLAEHQYPATHTIDPYLQSIIHVTKPGPFFLFIPIQHYCGQVIYLHLVKGLLKTLQMMEQTTAS